VEPERGLVDRDTDRQQAVVLEQQRLLVPERACKRAAFVGAVHDTGEVVEDRVVLVEGARVLAQRLQQATGGRPRPSAPGVRVRDRGDVRSRAMDLGVDRERRRVHRTLARDEVPVEVDQQEVRRAEVTPAPPERVEPEPVRKLRITDGDVARDPVVVPELREQPVRDRELSLAGLALIFDRS
jgi:hypothetical protein